jgi:mRNA-degrading endonuclease RelE of RelBE toxin-antitoxin system
MAFEVELTESARLELKDLRAYDKRRLSDEIDQQLIHEPDAETRNRKCLGIVPATFAYMPPLWELKVGDFRIFYNVDRPNMTVTVLAVRRKAPDQTTEEVLNA